MHEPRADRESETGVRQWLRHSLGYRVRRAAKALVYRLPGGARLADAATARSTRDGAFFDDLLSGSRAYWLGGTVAPINSVPAYFVWEGSPWNEQTMSGLYSHPNLLGLMVDDGKLVPDSDDEVVVGTRVTLGGKVVHEFVNEIRAKSAGGRG